MDTLPRDVPTTQELTRRDLLKAGLAAGAALSTGPLMAPGRLRAQGKRGGMLRVRGYDPPHFDPHLTLNFKTNTTLSFVYSKLVRHKVGAGVPPGTFAVEPDLAERWEEPDDTTVVFYLRKGVRWQNKPPVNGRELTAEDVKFTFDRFLTEKGNPLKFMLDPVDRVEVVDRYTVRFRLKEPFVWLVNMLANPDRHLDRRPGAGGQVRRSQAARDGDRHRPVRPGALRAQREDRLPAQPGLLPAGPALGRRGGVAGAWRTSPSSWPPTARDRSTAVPGTGGPSASRTWPRSRRAHPQFVYQDFLSNVTTGIYMRTDKPPFNDVRVRRAVSHAVDRQAVIDAVYLKGRADARPSAGASPSGLRASTSSGPGAQYYRHDPKEARRLLAEAGFPQGLKTQLNVTGGYGVRLHRLLPARPAPAQGERHRRGAEGAGVRRVHRRRPSWASTRAWPWARSASPGSRTRTLYGMYMPEQARNSSHVSDAKIIGDAAGADAHQGPRGAPEAHLRHPALRRRAAVLRLSLLRRPHRLLAARR